MAPINNDLNGPAIAFLTLAIVFLLLLILIWCRYLIWWKMLGKRFYEEKRQGEEARDGKRSASSSSSGRSQGRSRGASRPQSRAPNSSMVPWMPRTLPREQGQQPRPEMDARSTEETRAAYLAGSGVEDQDDGRIYLGKEPLREDAHAVPEEPGQISQEQGRKARQSFSRSGSEVTRQGLNPQEDRSGIFRQDGHRASSTRPESEIDMGGDRHARGPRRKEEQPSTDHTEREQGNGGRADQGGPFRNGSGSRNGRSELVYQEIAKSPPGIVRQPAVSTQDDEGTIDSQAQESRESSQIRNPISDRDHRGIRRGMRYGPRRQSTSQSIQANVSEASKRRKEAPYDRIRPGRLGERPNNGDSRRQDQSLGLGTQSTSPHMENLGGAGIVGDNHRYTGVPSRHMDGAALA